MLYRSYLQSFNTHKECLSDTPKKLHKMPNKLSLLSGMQRSLQAMFQPSRPPLSCIQEKQLSINGKKYEPMIFEEKDEEFLPPKVCKMNVAFAITQTEENECTGCRLKFKSQSGIIKLSGQEARRNISFACYMCSIQEKLVRVARQSVLMQEIERLKNEYCKLGIKKDNIIQRLILENQLLKNALKPTLNAPEGENKEEITSDKTKIITPPEQVLNSLNHFSQEKEAPSSTSPKI